MAIHPKATHRFNAIPIKVSTAFFTELEQTIQKCIWNHRRPRIAKAIPRGKKPSRNHNTPRLQTVLQSYSQQDRVGWYRNRHMDKRHRIEGPEINPDTSGQLIILRISTLHPLSNSVALDVEELS